MVEEPAERSSHEMEKHQGGLPLEAVEMEQGTPRTATQGVSSGSRWVSRLVMPWVPTPPCP